ncbi:MAG: SRPBCC family protein [Rhodoglobus sp.]
MPKSRSAATDAVARVGIADTYRIANTIDPTKVYPRFGPLPAVIEVRDQSGTWDTVGRTRQLMLSDGGSVIETITDAATPTFFAYELSDFQKLFGRLVSGARAEWTFAEADGGTRIRWTYAFHPLPGAGPVVGAIVGLFWARYMRRVLPRIVAEVERTAARA